MMNLRRRTLVLALGLLMPALCLAEGAQETPQPVETGPPPVTLSLAEAVQMSLKNNLDIKVAEKTPLIREQDIIFQEAAFDPNLGAGAAYQDVSRPQLNRTAIFEFKGPSFNAGFSDRLRYGSSYSADLSVSTSNSPSQFASFPTTYSAALELAYNQSLLRNFGRKVNETQIVIAQNNQSISRSQFRQQVLDALKATEDAYWELVFARQDLEVKNESLRLANELLKLNKIKVQVGTLPPIEITQAEAEVANREQGVIVAENTVTDAEDTLRQVLNMPKEQDAWSRPIQPTDQPTYLERQVDLGKELETAISRRPDLEQARLDTQNAESRLRFDRNQLKWDLGLRATYTLQGLAGDADTPLFPIFCDDSGIDGIASTGDPGEGDGICEGSQPDTGTTPAGPGENQVFVFLQQDQDFTDAFRQIRDRDFESWSVALQLGIPIGNNAAEASYSGSRLAKEQSEIIYERARLNAEVQVRSAARAIATNKKRIDAADKNVELQTKKVEAEQKKFENGMSTSFQVLEFQEDLTTALGARNRSLVDYRKSIAALEQAKGTLDEYLNVSVQ